MITFPKFLYHKDLAVEGAIFASAEACDEALASGWVDTPEKFDPNYVAPESVDDVDVPPESKIKGYVRQAYPSMRFNREGEAQIVKDADEDALLDGNVWKATPDPAAWDAFEVTPELQEQANADAVYNARVADVAVAIMSMTDVAKIEQVAAIEDANPDGSRKTVLKAIKARLAELASAAE